MKSAKTFIGQCLRHFRTVGAIAPSSSRLAKKMMKNVSGDIIVELGPGTGVFTKEILSKLPSNGKLISIESNPIFIDFINKTIKDERLILIEGNAADIEMYLNIKNIKKVNSIISGLPIGNFNRDDRERLMNAIDKVLDNDGIYIQFEYFLAGIFSVKKYFPRISIGFEFFNLPPAFIMRCRK